MTGRDLTPFQIQAGFDIRLEAAGFGADITVASELDASHAVPVLTEGAFVGAT